MEMFDKRHRGSLPNYYQLRSSSSKTSLTSFWRSINPYYADIFYVSVSDQLIYQSYSLYD